MEQSPPPILVIRVDSFDSPEQGPSSKTQGRHVNKHRLEKLSEGQTPAGTMMQAQSNRSFSTISKEGKSNTGPPKHLLFLWLGLPIWATATEARQSSVSQTQHRSRDGPPSISPSPNPNGSTCYLAVNRRESESRVPTKQRQQSTLAENDPSRLAYEHGNEERKG